MPHELTHLDLFSGIGGFALAAGWAGFRTVGFCEREPYAQAVLGKHWPEIPICDDIFRLDANQYRGVTLLTGGFPCQPFSVAGQQRGSEDDRHIWPEMLRVIKECRPTWIIGENVPGIVEMELDNCISDLENIGYTVQPIIVPACAVDAKHRRDRVWILAHSERLQQPREESCYGQNRRVGGGVQSVSWDRNWEDALREFRGMDDGLSYGVDRVDGIRNSIVPQVAYEIISAIAKIERHETTTRNTS